MSPSAEALEIRGERALGVRVARNAIWLLLARVGSQGMALLFTVIVARRLGETGLGQFAFISAVIYFANLATTFGTDMLIMRDVAAKGDPGVAPASLALQLGFSVPFILLVFVLAPKMPNQTAESILALKIYSLSLIPMAFYSVFSAVLRAIERMDSFMWLNILNGGLMVSLTWLFVQPSTSLVVLVWLLLGVQLICAIAATIVCASQYREVFKGWAISKLSLRRIARVAAPIASLGLLGALYQRSGIYLLTVIQGPAATGAFSAAMRIIEAAKLAHFAVLGAVFPTMALGAVKPTRSANRVISQSLWMLLILAGILTVLIFSFADLIIPILFGNGFLDSVPQLQILAWMLIPVTLTHFFSLMLLSAKRELAIFVSIAASLAFLVAFVALTLPRLDNYSVVWGILFAESLQAVVMLFLWLKSRSMS